MGEKERIRNTERHLEQSEHARPTHREAAEVVEAEDDGRIGCQRVVGRPRDPGKDHRLQVLGSRRWRHPHDHGCLWKGALLSIAFFVAEGR